MRVTKKKVNSPPMIMRLSLITTQTSLLTTLNLLQITQEMCLLLKATREMRNQRRMTLMFPQQMKPPPTVNPLRTLTRIFHQLTTPKQTTLQALQPQIPLRTRRPSLNQSKVAQQSQNPQNFRINVYACFSKTFLIRPKLRRATMHFSDLI